jgi:hypothetical protein
MGGGGEADMCWKFGIVKSIIQKILKNRSKILSVLEQKGLSIKQFQNPECSE